MINQVIVALDGMNRDEVFQFLKTRGQHFSRIKIGLELFCHYGPDIIKHIHNEFQKKIFLDLKLHDIPETVAKSIRALSGLPIEFLTIHLTGGEEMIRRSSETVFTHLPKTTLLGVTYLTSLSFPDDFKKVSPVENHNISDFFLPLLSLAKQNKCLGIVSSPQELKIIRDFEKENHHTFVKVTPGISLHEKSGADQKRVMNFKEAISNGANFVVIGRALTQVTDQDFAQNIKNFIS